MMTKKIFNSTFENSLRAVLLLAVMKKPTNLDRIYVLDFMVSYGAAFGFSPMDLNGDNPYKFSEFPSRRACVKDALKELVLDGYVMPIHEKNGIEYVITESGSKYSESLNSDYAKEYIRIAKNVIEKTSNTSERKMITEINQMSAENRRGGASAE